MMNVYVFRNGCKFRWTGRKRRAAFHVVLGLLLLPVTGQMDPGMGLDLNGDGISDVWASLYQAALLAPDHDPDLDGLTTMQESGTGTHPQLNSSVLKNQLLHLPEGLHLRHDTVVGKLYQLETSADLLEWLPAGDPFEGVGQPRDVPLPQATTQLLYRIRVYDQDRDQDGLTAYEEHLLGSSDDDATSTGASSESDYGRAFRLFSSPGVFDLNGQTVQGKLPTLAEASRFYQQAGLGATYTELEQLTQTGIPAWIDTQFSLPPTLHVPVNNQLTVYESENGEEPFPHSPYVWTWWFVSMNAQDQLRQRVAFALSEILVISQITDELEDHNWGIATYYDLLVTHAFGNYRDLLHDVATSPAMGNYLSHAKNMPANPALNRFPDENFAREIMQLFSIGLYELEQNGTRKQDDQGNPIATYTNKDIENFANVFTGLTYNPAPPTNGTPWFGEDDWTPILNEDDFIGADSQWMGLPMAGYDPLHTSGVKKLLRGAETNGNLEQDLTAAIDNLFQHPNTGPFIGRRLIQRLVTSNPSPAYVYRVAEAFRDNGQGVRGDMKAVIRAVLLDPEARNGSVQHQTDHGKLREPLLRHVHLARAFRMRAAQTPLRMDNFDGAQAYAMQPMGAPSVFNFYLPDHQPAGELREAGLVGPEFQITTSTTTIKTLNFLSGAIAWDGLITNDEELAGNDEILTDYQAELQLVEADNLPGLVERLNLLLTRGQMSSSTRQILEQTLQQAVLAEIEPDDLVRFAVTLIASSPDFAVLR